MEITFEDRYNAVVTQLNYVNRKCERLARENRQLKREQQTYLKIVTQLQGKKMK